jgi:hypothetical protein
MLRRLRRIGLRTQSLLRTISLLRIGLRPTLLRAKSLGTLRLRRILRWRISLRTEWLRSTLLGRKRLRLRIELLRRVAELRLPILRLLISLRNNLWDSLRISLRLTQLLRLRLELRLRPVGSITRQEPLLRMRLRITTSRATLSIRKDETGQPFAKAHACTARRLLSNLTGFSFDTFNIPRNAGPHANQYPRISVDVRYANILCKERAALHWVLPLHLHLIKIRKRQNTNDQGSEHVAQTTHVDFVEQSDQARVATRFDFYLSPFLAAAFTTGDSHRSHHREPARFSMLYLSFRHFGQLSKA